MVKKIEITKQGYDIKKGLYKFAESAAIVVLSGLLVMWQDDPKYIALVPVITMGLNYFKHRK